MSQLRTALVLSAAVGFVCGCTVPPTVADTEERLKQLTASVVSGAGDIKDISISDVRAFPTKREWRAKVGAKTYACDADERLNLPQCATIEPPPASS